MQNQKLINNEESVLVVIDVQEKLLSQIHEVEKVINNSARLARFANIMRLPIVVTEQINIGPTHETIMKEVEGVDVIKKLSFSCFGEPVFVEEIEKLGRTNLIIVGIETHICVAQTAIDALENYNVHVVADAVSSRTPENRKIGLKRMKQAGAVVTSCEMVMFELMKKAGTDQFRAVLPLVK